MNAALDNPEWKKKADASAPVFGKQDTRSIRPRTGAQSPGRERDPLSRVAGWHFNNDRALAR